MRALRARTANALAGTGKRISGTLEATATERDDANSDNTIEIPQAAGTSRRKQTWLEIGRFLVHDLTQTI
jgi:hypothetical protein